MKKFLLFLIPLSLFAITTVTWPQIRSGLPKTGTFVLTGTNGVIGWGSPTTINFSGAEIPNGVINGINTIFTLLHPPIGNSLLFTINGIVQQNGTTGDYTLSGSTITLVTGAAIPNTGDVIQAWYRY